MRGDSQKLFAVLAIALVSSVILAVIFWPQLAKWESVRFRGCTPCGDEAVKLEVLNYPVNLATDQNVFEGVRIRVCNCRADKVDMSGARIGYTVELPGGTPKCSGSYLLPKNKDGTGPLVPSLEPQEGAKFDWYSTSGSVGMAPESDKVPISRPSCDPAQSPNLEESASGKVVLGLFLDGVKEGDDYVWNVFYAPLCPGTCRDWTGFYCYPTETEIGVLNCGSDKRCCK